MFIYFLYFVIIFLLEKGVALHLNKLESPLLHPRMLCTKLDWNWTSDKESYFQYTVQECQFLSELTTVLLTKSTYIFIFSQFNFTFQRYKNLIISFIKKYFVQHLCKMLQNIPFYVQHVSVFARWCALTIYTSVHPVWTNHNQIY